MVVSYQNTGMAGIAAAMTRKHVLYDEAPDVLRMFPSFAWKANLKANVHQSLNENIVKALDQIRRDEPALAPGHAWQSDQHYTSLMNSTTWYPASTTQWTACWST
jgi:hypothetical protein